MVKGLVPIKSPHLTKRALDAGDSARFSSFSRLSFFLSGRLRRPSAPARVTRTVGRHAVSFEVDLRAHSSRCENFVRSTLLAVNALARLGLFRMK